MIDYTYKDIPEHIQTYFEAIPQARMQLKNYRAAKSEKARAIFGDKLFSIYANNGIWLAWYQHQAKVLAGRKGGKSTSDAKKPPAAPMVN